VQRAGDFSPVHQKRQGRFSNSDLDITYIATDEGWVYMAWFRRRPDECLIFHSDRGIQYCGHEFQNTLKDYKMKSSMSRKGNC